jgi:hypothetical protein
MFCNLGFHKWSYYKPLYGSDDNRRRGIYVRAEYRKCQKCGLTQVKSKTKINGKTKERWLTYKL